MASPNAGSPPIGDVPIANEGDIPNADDGDAREEDSGNVALDSQPTPGNPPAAAAGEESSDLNPETPNGKRSSRHSKKQKNDAAGKFSPGGGESNRREREEWSESAMSCLLEAYTVRYIKLNRTNLRGKDWEEVAELVGAVCDKKSKKSIEQCKNKIDNLKKRYKVELQRMNNNGLTVSSWKWFKKIEVIAGNVVVPPAKSTSDDDERSVGGSSGNTLRRSARLAPNNATAVNNMNSKSVSHAKWRRVVLKVSGTALAGNGASIDPKVALLVAKEVAAACRLGIEVAIVVGGRNFFCGDSWVSATDLDRPTAYQIGMMATVMNSLLLQSALEKLGVQTHVQSAFAMPEVAEPYNRLRAMRHLQKGRVVIFGGVGAGSGNPLFTTDTAAALRASEINADAVLKGTNVNGIYDRRDKSAPLDHISFREAVSRNVSSMDMMAIQFCEENGMPVVIFNLLEPGNISRALSGEQVGTLIDQDDQ